MTDSTTESPAGKRERLVASARTLLHQQGVERTTIAEVAEGADVPPGNVYYYFKTKDELIEAAVAARSDDLEHMLGALERLPPGTAARTGASARNSANVTTISSAVARSCWNCRSVGRSDSSVRWVDAMPVSWRLG